MTNFCSDNVAGASPQILEALARAGEGAAMPYGNDDLTRRVEARLREVFETNCAVFPVATGTAANALALSLMTPPFGAIYCHAEAHVNVDECGAPELYSGGAKLVGIAAPDGKLTPELLAAAITGAGDQHSVQPAAVSLTQATEADTVYRPAEIAEIAELAHARGLGLQMDGALRQCPGDTGREPGRGDLEGRRRRAHLRRHQERRPGRRGAGALQAGAGRELPLPAQARRPPVLQDALPLGSARGLPGRRPLAGQRAPRQRHGPAPGRGPVRVAGRRAVAHGGGQRDLRPPARGAGRGADRRGLPVLPLGPPARTEVRLVTAFNTAEADVDAFLAAAARLAAA